MADITWLYSDSDADTPAGEKTASGLSFLAGDRILVVGYAYSNGNGSTHAMGVTDNAATNNPTWSVLASSAYNTLSSSAFATRMTILLSDELTADETFSVTLDYQTGSGNTYYGVMGVARVTGITGVLVRSGSDIGAYRDDDATCALGGAVASGNLALMVLGMSGPAPFTVDTVPTDFTQVTGSTSTTTGDTGITAIKSTSTTASSISWGYEAASNDADFMCAVAIELAAAAGGPVEGAARLVSVLFGMAYLGFFYALVRRIAGPTIAAVATAILVWWTREPN
jgi:hypothetical protein